MTDNTQELRKIAEYLGCNADELISEVMKWHNKRELEARIDENNRWRTILVPSDDYNTADMEDFNDRVVELKQELEKL